MRPSHHILCRGIASKSRASFEAPQNSTPRSLVFFSSASRSRALPLTDTITTYGEASVEGRPACPLCSASWNLSAGSPPRPIGRRCCLSPHQHRLPFFLMRSFSMPRIWGMLAVPAVHRREGPTIAGACVRHHAIAQGLVRRTILPPRGVSRRPLERMPSSFPTHSDVGSVVCCHALCLAAGERSLLCL